LDAGTAEPHPLAAHILQRPRAARAAASAKPAFFDRHQFATLTAAADLILPGSVASGSPAFIDRVLAVEAPGVRQQVVGALGALDALARTAHRHAFTALARPDQVAVLESIAGDTAPGAIMHVLKTWIAGAHYSSEAGMKERGWTGLQFHPAFPACAHGDAHE
jgi:hypothetical protein